MSDLVALVSGFAVGAGALAAVLASRRGSPQVAAAPARPAPARPAPARPAPAPATPARPSAPPRPPSPPRPSGTPVGRLTVEGQRGTSVVLGSTPVTLGRGSDQGLRIADGKASRAHAVVRPRRKGGWQLEDAGSANGTRVNDHRVPDGRVVPLRDGDRIGIGGATVLYTEQVEPADPGSGPDPTRVL